ncbi:MAG: hypothetical protein HFF62_06890 [Oscillospiraceae bacterium]|nr:hypothetical protein [Oscillospiraceae bacterium]
MNIEEKILQLLEKQGEMIGQINDRLGRLEDRMDRLEGRMDRMESRMDKLEGQMDRLESRMDKLEGRMDKLEGRMDNLEGRIDKLETSQAAMQATLDEHTAMLKNLDERSLKSAVLLETEVPRKFNLLYEGHSVIMENMRGLAEKSRVEALEDDVAMMKDSIKLLRIEVNALQKAQ